MVKKFIIAFLTFLFIFTIPASFWAEKSLAQTTTTFKFQLASNLTSANSNLTFDLSVPAGLTLPNNVDINLPAGWDVKGGVDVAQGAQVASGKVRIKYLGTTYDLNIAFFNEQDTLGNKARWKIVVGDEPFTLPEGIIFWNWTGSQATGHVFDINSPIIADLSTPLVLNFTFFGVASSGQPVLVNPATGNNYILSFDLNYAVGSVTTLPVTIPISSTATGSVEGTLTSSGTTVTNSFISGISITFDRVLGQGGQTTITSSTTPPPAGTGEFLVGGVYYDFNTTANILCPCTVSIPYDPAVTPSPRIYHLESGVWVDVTTSVDSVNKTVTGIVSSFSIFTTGEPLYGLEFLDPVAALLAISDPMRLERNRTLPVNFTLTDGNGEFVSRSDVSVQVVRVADNVLIAEITAEPLKQHYKALLSLKDLNLSDGTYKLRVKVANTVYSPAPLFNPVSGGL